MGLVERIYAGASRLGLLVGVQHKNGSFSADFSSADESILDGLARGADYMISFPASEASGIAAGETLNINGVAYRVRDVRAVADGSECRASLTRLP